MSIFQDILENIRKKQEEERKRQEAENQAYRKYMSNPVQKPSQKQVINQEVRTKNQQISKENKQIGKTDDVIWKKYEKEARSKGLWMGDDIYQYALKRYQEDPEAKSQQLKVKKTDVRAELLDKNMGANYKTDPRYYEKIKAGQKNNIMRKGQTADETYALAEGWKDTFLTGARDLVSEEEKAKLDYLLGDQELTGKDRSVEIQDVINEAFYRGGQRFELNEQKYGNTKDLSSKVDPNNKTLKKAANLVDTAARGVENTFTGYNAGAQRLLGGNISPSVVSAEAIQQAEDIDKMPKGEKFINNALYSLTNMASAGSPAGFFTSIAGNAYSQSRAENKSDSESITYALMNAGMETFLRSAGGRALGGVKKFTGIEAPILQTAAKRLSKNPVVQRSIGSIMDLGAEGTEEYMQTVLEPVLRNVAFGENNAVDLTPEGGLESFLIGAVVAGGMNAHAYKIGLKNDLYTMNLDWKLSDGTMLQGETVDALFNALNYGTPVTEEQKIEIETFAQSAKDDEIKGIYKKMDDIAQTMVGNGQTVGEFNQTVDAITDPGAKIDFLINEYENMIHARAKQAEVIQNTPDAVYLANAVRTKTESKLADKVGYKVEHENMLNSRELGKRNPNTKTLTINENKRITYPKLVTFIHEIGHTTEGTEAYKQMVKAIKKDVSRMGENFDDLKTQMIDRYAKAGKTLNDTKAEQEVVVKYLEEVIFNGDEAEVIRFAHKNPKAFRGIYKALGKISLKANVKANLSAAIESLNNAEKKDTHLKGDLEPALQNSIADEAEELSDINTQYSIRTFLQV
jgi:hypothetical protein